MCPIRDYVCTVCNQQVEKIEKMNDDSFKNSKCEECKHGFMARQISPPNFNFKGGGWPTKDIKRRRK